MRNPTEPDLPTRIVASPVSDVFTNSPQSEPRELLIDGRPTDIEWNVAGDPVMVLLHGSEGRGGDYYASVRALWSYSPYGTQDSIALYMLVQWADPGVDFREQPLITSVDWHDPDGNNVDCNAADPLHDEANWRRATDVHEDQVEIELYSDVQGGFPADRWRWGAGTTDPATPVPPTEYPSAGDEEFVGATLHPTGGFSEDMFNSGSGWVRDAGRVTYEPNFVPGSNVPLRIAGKGSRDTRLNRGKPTAVLIWRYVARVPEPCDSLNPIRIDDASSRDKSWNPDDYVPSYVLGLPEGSQADVVSRGGWDSGKYALELRRLLQPGHNDDVPLISGRTYGLRFKIYNASKTSFSESPILPLYIRPRS